MNTNQRAMVILALEMGLISSDCWQGQLFGLSPKKLPVLRFRSIRIDSGASEPAGWTWITALVISVAMILGLVLLR